jgi:hypothetical protein
MSWRDTAKDPDEVKVFMALEEPNTWRTVGGVSRETGLSEEQVEAILAKYNLSLTRRTETLSISGKPLVALIENVGS